MFSRSGLLDTKYKYQFPDLTIAFFKVSDDSRSKALVLTPFGENSVDGHLTIL